MSGHRSWRKLLPGAAILIVAGCSAPVEPTQREGTWRPTGSNDANLRAMVADPAHLSQGVESNGGRGWQASQAIGRLRDDKVKPLPDVRASRVGPSLSTGPGR